MYNYEEILYKCFPSNLLNEDKKEWGIVGDCETPKLLAYATTLTPDVVEDASQNNVNVIITHHAAWDFMYEQKEKAEQLLKKYKITNVWCHLPLDKADFGTAVSLLSLLNCEPFAKLNNGEGRMSKTTSTQTFDEIKSILNKKLSEVPAREYDAKIKIKNIATLTGAGTFTNYLKEALKHEVDLFITGETSLYLLEYAKYHNVSVLIYSHNYTEVFGVKALAKRFSQELSIPIFGHLNEEHF
jgi:putative NIF3 family GTP cyclohydrolase 1 type 2